MLENVLRLSCIFVEENNEKLSIKSSFVIGLMSGTSLDGVDIVYVKFDETNTLSYELLKADTIAYTKAWQNRLSQAFYTNADSISKLNIDYGFFLGDLVNAFIDKHQITDLDFISSHGHTIFHRPKEYYTLQIGHGAAIANRTGFKVVCDFRAQDVIRGGEGAPLVPIGDDLLFNEYDFCLNIGGFANYSFEKDNKRYAKDLCPANILLNHYSRKEGFDYDNNGQNAKKGTINDLLLKELNNMPYYHGNQSMAYEDIENLFLPLINKYQLSFEDTLRTLVEHITHIIAQNINPQSTVLTTGGGAYNIFLIERIKQQSQANIILPSKQLINYKEALIFALLGYLRLQKKVNILSTVTHVDKDHSSGVIFYP